MIRNRFLRALFVIASVAALSLVAACDQDLLDDSTFRLWCGDSLCAWRLDTGHVRQAPTWHKDDYGVELVDTPTTISQELHVVTRCLVFSSIADVDPSAQVTVAIDFNGDGKTDYEQPIAGTNFREVRTQVTAPHAVGTTRLYLTKKGQGRAVLAQLRLIGNTDCSAPRLRLHDRPLGDSCTQGDPVECASGICCFGVCSECCVAGDDGGTKPINVNDDDKLVDAPEKACPNGGTCATRDVRRAPFTVIPLQCNPGDGTRPSGSLCLADDDCASGDCAGAKATLYDTGGCAPELPKADAGESSCLYTGVREGHCR